MALLTSFSAIRIKVGILLILFSAPVLYAQSADSVKVKHKDTIKHVHPYPIPMKAMLFSVACPGLGQIYNKRYWKLPIIYVGMGVATYFIITNGQTYNTYNSALKLRDNGGMDAYYNIYTADEMSTIITYYHRNRDISVIAAAAIYILQIVDANVDAQLHGFDVSDNISFHLSPTLSPVSYAGTYTFVAGVSFSCKL